MLSLLTMMLLAGRLLFDKTTPGRLLEGAVYAWLQTRLTNNAQLAVIVVDISNLDAQQVLGHPTPREQLQSLVDVIAAEKPDAIGIDVDLSRDEHGWTERGGPQLFDHLLNMPIPVYVGVGRSRYGRPEDWLGALDYKDLAVALVVPANDNRKMPLWIGKGDPNVCLALVSQLVGMEAKHAPVADQGSCLVSMSAALALRYRSRDNHSIYCPEWFARPFDTVTINKVNQMNAALFLVDYGAVSSLREHTYQAIVSGQHVLLVKNSVRAS